MLQEAQTTKIKPSSSWINLDLKEIWMHRELLYFLTWRDVKVRYKQTAIGVLWVILQPVLTTAIFTVLFSNFDRFNSGEIPYPLFALSGLLIWFFVNTAITNASNSLISNKNLVTKIYFPRLIVPLSAALAGLIDLGLGFLLLIGLMIYYGATVLMWQVLLAPVFIFLAIIISLSFGTLFSALNVRFRDVKYALPFVLQIWLFLSPIFYPSSILSEKWRIFLAFNPLTGITEGFRNSLFGKPLDWTAINVSLIATAILALLSIYVFKKMEDDFADLI
jgi:lipopolysaccharide transport system permease protein